MAMCSLGRRPWMLCAARCFGSEGELLRTTAILPAAGGRAVGCSGRAGGDERECIVSCENADVAQRAEGKHVTVARGEEGGLSGERTGKDMILVWMARDAPQVDRLNHRRSSPGVPRC